MKKAVDVYINFNGNCREAVEFYAQVFKTEKPQIMSFGDTPPDPSFPLPEDMDKIKALFNKLKEGGKVGMELQETFWSKCYGSLTDKFGIGWQFSHEGEQSVM